MRGTYCDIHGHSNTDFRYADWTVCWRCQSKLLNASDAVQRVRELHQPTTWSDGTTHCAHCNDYEQPTYPCDTIRALDNE